MKKGLVVVFGLMACVLLSACGDKTADGKNGGKSLDDLQGNLSFTVDELEILEKQLFPVSYTYATYHKEDGSLFDTGEYIYTSDDEYLLPIEKFIVNKEVSSSDIENDMIYSMVDAVLEGGEMVSILYINDPETLKYSYASLYAENETTLYTFSY